MPLGRKVGLVPSDIVLDGDPAPPPQKGDRAPNFRSTSIVAKRLDGSRYHLVRRSGHIVLDGDQAHSPPKKKGRAQPLQFSAHVYCGQTVAHLTYC